MHCYLCGCYLVLIWDRDEGGKSLECVLCGRYDISGDALAAMAKHPNGLDVELNRLWLEEQRKMYINPPLIDSQTAYWN